MVNIVYIIKIKWLYIHISYIIYIEYLCKLLIFIYLKYLIGKT